MLDVFVLQFYDKVRVLCMIRYKSYKNNHFYNELISKPIENFAYKQNSLAKINSPLVLLCKSVCSK